MANQNEIFTPFSPLLLYFSILLGVIIHTNVKILSVSYTSSTAKNTANNTTSPWGLYAVTIEIDNIRIILESEQLLIATGRAPNVHDMGLEKVRILIYFLE